jgi:hypothetical protein
MCSPSSSRLVLLDCPKWDFFYSSFTILNFNTINYRYIERPLRAEKLLVDLQKMNDQPEEFGKLYSIVCLFSFSV